MLRRRSDLMKLKFLCSLTFLAALRAQPAPVSLRIVPADVTFWGDQSSQHFLVLAHDRNGMDRDVTSTARLSLSSPGNRELDKSGKFTAKANGAVKLSVQV